MGMVDAGWPRNERKTMMNSRNLFPVLILLGLAGLCVHGCSEDDGGGGDPFPDPCSISVISPATGTIFQPGNDEQDDCTIRWNHTGEFSTVDITLVKGEADVGPIATDVANNGLYFWEADNLGANNGSDFRIRVCASAEPACCDESGPFTLVNTNGCYFTFTNEWQGEYDAGDTLNLTWNSENTTGTVDLELHTLATGFVGGIAAGVPNSGTYDWIVDSFHYATSYGFYQIKLVDHEVENCYALGDTFGIFDPDICSITVLDPARNVIWHEGEQHDINLNVSDDVQAVDLRLYVGNIFVEHIALDVDVTTSTSYTWTVNDWDQNIGGNSTYRIRAYNADDRYCMGISDVFTIVAHP
ncbi:hypothetical protein CSA17_03820 [bacterium DOLJORAL78_65_58]|nr:MAG: hypothetical protein CSA17_03820 [bacterium DOLJORAL78_65_58]